MGAAAARGRFIVTMNDDVEVLAGWLEALVACAEENPEAGAVAPKYLETNGVLQDAGGIIWRDGNASRFGWGDDPDRPQYSYRREIDYGSAAAMLIRADAWAEVGGLDPHFRPMYWEDTDLSFRLRELGVRVMYEPAAVVVHHDGASAGRDETQGLKRYQAINKPRFASRWKSRLAELPEPREHWCAPSEPAPLHPSGPRCRQPRARTRSGLGVVAHEPDPPRAAGNGMPCLPDAG